MQACDRQQMGISGDYMGNTSNSGGQRGNARQGRQMDIDAKLELKVAER